VVSESVILTCQMVVLRLHHAFCGICVGGFLGAGFSNPLHEFDQAGVDQGLAGIMASFRGSGKTADIKQPYPVAWFQA